MTAGRKELRTCVHDDGRHKHGLRASVRSLVGGGRRYSYVGCAILQRMWHHTHASVRPSVDGHVTGSVGTPTVVWGLPDKYPSDPWWVAKGLWLCAYMPYARSGYILVNKV
jgi:hypothetical protein